LFEKLQTPSFCPVRADLCVENPGNTKVLLAVFFVKPPPKIRHFLYFQTSPKGSFKKCCRAKRS